MSSILSSQGVFLATAMAAFSGTVILLAFKHQKSCLLPSNTFFDHDQVNPNRVLRPCLSSGEKRGEKKKKRVRFAKDVVDPKANNEEFRRQFNGNNNTKSRKIGKSQLNEVVMPANRVALYKGILKDRVIQRMGYSY